MTWKKRDGVSPLNDYDWYAFQGIEGENWGEMYEAFQRNEQGCVSEEATRGPESKSPLENEGGQGGGRRMVRPHTSRQHQGKKRDKISTLG